MNLSTVVDTPIFMSGLSLSLHNRNSIFRHVGVNTNTVAAKFEHWNRKMAKRREKMKKEWKHRKWKRLRAKSIFNLHAIIFLSFIALSITLIVYLYSRASKSTPKSELKASEHLVQWNTSLFGITMRLRVIDIRWHGRGIAFRCSHTNPESYASEYRFFSVLGEGTFFSDYLSACSISRCINYYHRNELNDGILFFRNWRRTKKKKK